MSVEQDEFWLLANYSACQALKDAFAEALQECCDETDYCYVCGHHPSSGHDTACKLGPRK